MEQIAETLAARSASCEIACANWEAAYPYQPRTTVHLARTDRYLYILFSVAAEQVRALHTRDLEAVYEDSCVEFFLANADNTRYWNFEFNAIGTCNASVRKDKKTDVRRLSEAELQSIVRFPSLGTAPIAGTNAPVAWSLIVGIPLALIGCEEDMPPTLRGNFYKCGDKTARPHYLSWNPIPVPAPNFHLPQYFGELQTGAGNQD
ncbi:MAG: carbohydrate-binding family 9-like protein [Paludibacteraceae bacterium]